MAPQLKRDPLGRSHELVTALLPARFAIRYPNAEDVRAVQAAGGRVLYQFRVALLRAELDTGAVRALVKGPAAIANAAFTVPDTTKFDANVQIFYDRAITDADKDTLRTLGVVEVDQASNPVLGASVPDSLIPRIGALPGVQFVRATGWGCAVERGNAPGAHD